MNYRKLALALPFALLLVACGEKAMIVIDAAVDAAIDAATDGGDASAQGPTEMAVTCDQAATWTVVNGANTTVWTVKYSDIAVIDPLEWDVVTCGQLPATNRSACPAGATCTGSLPPYADCYRSGAAYTGSKIHVECLQQYTSNGGSPMTITGITSAKLVRR